MNELEQIDDYIYRMLVSLLLKMVPEYKSIYERNYSLENLPDIGVYLFMNEFATCLSDEIRKDSSSNFVTNAFTFINAVGERHNMELLNIVKVGILEILYTEKGVERLQVSGMLSDKLKRDFNAFSEYYN
jgi:hypothetical protein